ncbi:ROK family glucokinase [Sediminibacillus massiliensis]|uniref:ROK family glucokinase n=1 Tax=Sediminibacillus massiliensis TaxID=1926277 RepID=UPI0009883978|nr:ROK family glucokinase [Sediminibacillus massiliensis]
MAEKYAIGIDIGGTTVKQAIISESGTIIDKWEIETNTANGGISIPDDIWASIEKKLEELAINKDFILGIGAGAPGFVEPSTGIVSIAVNIGWKDFDLKGQLEEKSGLPVLVDNDANIAALGENWLGSGNQADNLVAVTLGTGVGGGIISNKLILNGANGTAGEIGHFTVEPDGAPCNCGRRGCLETIASATGIARLASDVVASGCETILRNYLNDNGKVTSKDVFEAAEKDDQAAIELIEHVTDVLGLAIANTATVINPSKIVISGGVSLAGEQLLRPLRKAFDKHALPRISEACEFVIAELGNDAGVIGAAFLVKQAQQG